MGRKGIREEGEGSREEGGGEEERRGGGNSGQVWAPRAHFFLGLSEPDSGGSFHTAPPPAAGCGSPTRPGGPANLPRPEPLSAGPGC